jgi:hypothetical protein
MSKWLCFIIKISMTVYSWVVYFQLQQLFSFLFLWKTLRLRSGETKKPPEKDYIPILSADRQVRGGSLMGLLCYAQHPADCTSRFIN